MSDFNRGYLCGFGHATPEPELRDAIASFEVSTSLPDTLARLDRIEKLSPHLIGITSRIRTQIMAKAANFLLCPDCGHVLTSNDPGGFIYFCAHCEPPKKTFSETDLRTRRSA